MSFSFADSPLICIIYGRTLFTQNVIELSSRLLRNLTACSMELANFISKY